MLFYLDLPEISLQEVWEHSTFDDAWIVIYDRVYDITDFVMRHPGGEDVFHGYMGYDGTIAFRGVGHSSAAMRILKKMCIGVLPQARLLKIKSSNSLFYFYIILLVRIFSYLYTSKHLSFN